MTKIEKAILLGLVAITAAGMLTLCYGAYQNQKNRETHEEPWG
ncbi:hypothetical protein [Dyadobacter bucti]|nr:hypothetical protein [Dyadobacter bucti]